MSFLNIGVRGQCYNTGSQIFTCGNVKISGVFSTIGIVFKRAWLCALIYICVGIKRAWDPLELAFTFQCVVIWVLGSSSGLLEECSFASELSFQPVSYFFHFLVCLGTGFLGINSWRLIMSHPVGAWDWIWDSGRAASALNQTAISLALQLDS